MDSKQPDQKESAKSDVSTGKKSFKKQVADQFKVNSKFD